MCLIYSFESVIEKSERLRARNLDYVYSLDNFGLSVRGITTVLIKKEAGMVFLYSIAIDRRDCEGLGSAI